MELMLLILSLMLDAACLYVCTEFMVNCIKNIVITGNSLDTIKDYIGAITATAIIALIFYATYIDVDNFLKFIGGEY